MECEQAVLDPYYCVAVIPPDANGSQLIPSILSMNPHPLGAIGTGDYYGPVEYSIDLRNSAIAVDGNVSDWPEMTPLATDTRDAEPYDFKTLYGFYDDNNLYLRIDPYSHFPAEGPADFEINIQTDDRRSHFSIYALAHEPGLVHLAQLVSDTGKVNLQITYKGQAIGEAFEVIIPLEFLGYPKAMTIEVVTSLSDETSKIINDSFEPVTLTVGAGSEGVDMPADEETAEPPAATTPTIIPANPLVSFDWHRYWNTFWWMVPLLFVTGILIAGILIRIKRKR